MAPYADFYSAVRDLHERGYTQDFVLFGEYLYWVQEKLLIASSEFIIRECHQFSFPAGRQKDSGLLILGISVLSEDVRGLLLDNRRGCPLPAVILEKLSEMEYHNALARIGQHDHD